MKRSKLFSKLVLAFAVTAAAVSSQLAMPAFAGTDKEYAPSGEVITQDTLTVTLPTVYLKINGGMDEFNKVNNSKDHSYEASGKMDIVVPDSFNGYVDSDAAITGLNDADIEYIRGRGNSTWTPGAEKNPFKIKLANKTDIFGMGKSKHWALLANIFDGSLSKDRLSAYVADQLGLDYTPMSYPVDVMVGDGEGEYTYLGSYLLAETVRVEKNRVDITLPGADETSEGEYLFSLAQELSGPDYFKTEHKVEYQNGDPSFSEDEDEKAGTEAQKEYIRSFVQDAENAAMLGRVRDEKEASGWKEVKASDYIDYESAARYWLVQNFSNNRDSYKNGSTYFYKTADSGGEKGKLYSGPVWDLDLAYRNILNTEGYSHTVPWMLALMRDESFFNIVKNEWSRKDGLRDQFAALAKDGGMLDKYAAEIGTSAAQDRLVHPDVYSEESPAFDAEIGDLKDWIKARIAWLDEHLYELPGLVKTVTLKYGDGEYDFDRYYGLENTQFMNNDFDYPKDGLFLTGWLDENGEDVDLLTEYILKDRVFTAKYIDESDVTRVEEIYFSDLHPAAALEDDTYLCRYTVYPEDAMDKKQIKWSSSDETVATVSEDGNMYVFKSTGKTTITAQLYNGKKFSYELTVFDKTAKPESINVIEDSLELSVGERAQAEFILFPENAKYDMLNYNMEMLEGENVIDIDMNGMITALHPGKVKVTVVAVNFVNTESGMELKTVKDNYVVTVKAPEQKEIKVSAVWDDGDNKDGIRPESVFITLMADGDFFRAAELYEGVNWEAVCSVPLNAEITARVFKTEVITGTDGEGTYSYEVTGSAEDGFVVTFTHSVEDDDSSDDDSSDDDSSEDESSEDESSEDESSEDDSSEDDSSEDSSEDESSEAASSGDESSDSDSSGEESSVPESVKDDESSVPADSSKDSSPNTGAPVSLLAASMVLAAAVVTVIKRKDK